MNWWLSGRVSALHSVVAGSISSGGDHGIHCWWDLIRLKQLSSVSVCRTQVFAGFSGHGNSIHDTFDAFNHSQNPDKIQNFTFLHSYHIFTNPKIKKKLNILKIVTYFLPSPMLIYWLILMAHQPSRIILCLGQGITFIVHSYLHFLFSCFLRGFFFPLSPIEYHF